MQADQNLWYQKQTNKTSLTEIEISLMIKDIIYNLKLINDCAIIISKIN